MALNLTDNQNLKFQFYQQQLIERDDTINELKRRLDVINRLILGNRI